MSVWRVFLACLISAITAATSILLAANYSLVEADILGQFSVTGHMTNQHAVHTATLINSGEVLVTGGFDAGGVRVASAELFDPDTGTWSETGGMQIPRSQHTATLLNDGRVLIAGGIHASPNTTSDTAELYDNLGVASSPAAGNMSEPRFGHTATLLASGEVLIVGGGREGNNIYNSMELFDPSTNTFSSLASSLGTVRREHTATLLNTGEILFVGGYDGSGHLNVAERFDPDTLTFSQPSTMTVGRANHRATLLTDGRVLVTGGDGPNFLDSAEIYDPSSNSWAAVPNMSVPRGGGGPGHSSTLLTSGKVLVVGGSDSGGVRNTSAQLFDPSTNSWSLPFHMNDERSGHMATLLNNGKVLISGGQGEDVGGQGVVHTSAEIYEPCTTSVTNFNDTGAGSLREAIICANQLPGQDTITLETGTYTLSIAGTGEDATATGDLDITDDLIITGVGVNDTIVDANSIDRVFQILSGSTVSIRNVTLEQGSASSDGGAIYNTGTLSLNGVVLRDNSAPNFCEHGGAIYNDGTLDITSSTIDNNTSADAGGGILNDVDGILTVTNSTLSNNSGGANCLGHFGSGGAIYNHGTLLITDSTINNNTTVDDGGGVRNEGVLTVVNSTLSNNVARDAGGGIYSPDTADLATILSSTLTDNTADRGGGIFGTEDTAQIANSIIAGNIGPDETTGPIPTDPLLEDDFNSYSSGALDGQSGWSGSTKFNVQGVTVLEGTKAIEVAPSGRFEDIGIGKTGNALEEGTVEVYLRKSRSTSGDLTFQLTENGPTHITIDWRNNGVLGRLVGSTFTPMVEPAEDDTWYLVVIEFRSGQFKRQRITVRKVTSTVPLTFEDAFVGAWETPHSHWSSNLNGVWLRAFGDFGTEKGFFDFIGGFPTAGDPSRDCSSALTSLGHNLIGDSSDCSISATTGDLIGTSDSPIDPKLGPLQNNGGSTETRALLDNSPAIDAANPLGCIDGDGNPLTTDQRGVSRSQGSACDMGAYELVQNRSPQVTSNNPSVEFDEGDVATNTGTIIDLDGDFVTLTTDLGSITNNGNGIWSWSFATNDGPANSQTVSVFADDGNGGTDQTSFELTVNNVAPTAAFNTPSSVDEGGDINLSLTNPSDPSSADTTAGFLYAFDCGDGSGYGLFTSTNAAVCPTEDNGNAAVGGKIQDKDGATSTYTATVTVNNVPPTVTADNTAITTDEGETSQNSGTFSDPGDDNVTITASVGTITQDTGNSGSWSWSFNTTDGPDDGQTITITATDSDGAQSTATFDLVVNNVAPTVGADKPSVTVNEGDIANNTGTFSDPGNDNVTITASVGTITQDTGHSGSWSWSFNTTDGPDDGQTVTITATDSDGAQSTATFVLVVNNVAPTVGADNAIVTVNEGDTADNNGTFSDPGDDNVTITASVGTITQDPGTVAAGAGVSAPATGRLGVR